MASAAGIRESLKAAAKNLWGVAENTGSAIKTAGGRVKGAVGKADEYVSGHITANEGSFGGAIKGIAQQKPVTSAIAATAAVGGTVYAGKQVFGRHIERVMRERANDNERTR